MPLTITKLKMWKDPKYTRGCLEVPPVGSKKLPTPDYVSANDETLRPRKGSTLTSLELPLSYTQVFDMSYLYIEASDGSGTIKLFGWIDTVTLIATSSDAVRIDWSVDWWRTYSGDAVFGAGQITRCNNGQYKRPYGVQPRMWIPNPNGYVKNFSDVDYHNYFLLMVTSNIGNEKRIRYWYGPIIRNDEESTEGVYGYELWNGSILSIISNAGGVTIDPESVIGCWMLPMNPGRWVPPGEGSGLGVRSIYAAFRFDNTGVKTWLGSGKIATSDDTHRTVLIDPYGKIASELPWGMTIGSYSIDDDLSIFLNVSTESVDIIITNADKGENALTKGEFLIAHGISIPILSNAWASYTYSGQREYEKRTAEIQRNQQAVTGLASAGSSATGGAIGGAIAGAAGGPIGAVGGAVLGAVGPLLNVGVNYFASGYFNDELQDAKDKLISNQAASVNIGGEGIAWEALNGNWEIWQLIPDNVSLAEYTAQIQQNGYAVDIQAQNTSTFLNAGGPVQIQQQIVTGDIPPQAKQAIKDKLSAGVRIVENNPTGVIP